MYNFWSRRPACSTKKQKKKIYENLLLPMAHFLATICPHFVKNAAWCRGSPNWIVQYLNSPLFQGGTYNESRWSAGWSGHNKLDDLKMDGLIWDYFLKTDQLLPLFQSFRDHLLIISSCGVHFPTYWDHPQIILWIITGSPLLTLK